MKCGLVAADGAVLHRETRPTPREAGGRAVLDALLETVVELGQKATADGHTEMPAPTSPSSAARSRTMTCQPHRCSATAAVTPPIPAPTTIAVLMTSTLHL